MLTLFVLSHGISGGLLLMSSAPALQALLSLRYPEQPLAVSERAPDAIDEQRSVLRTIVDERGRRTKSVGRPNYAGRSPRKAGRVLTRKSTVAA